MPIQYYKGNPEELIRIGESEIERARILRREKNMKERKGGKTAGSYHDSFRELSGIEKNSTGSSLICGGCSTKA